MDRNISRSVKYALAIAILICTLPALADGKLDDAVKRLSAVGVFAFGGTGFAGTISQGEINYRFVLSQPPPVALAAFEKLYASGNPQAKAYALTGIKKLDPTKFHELTSTAKESTEKVQTMHGCILSHRSLHDIAGDIERLQP